VTLIGATTENPYFELNSALLSRTQLYELEPLSTTSCARCVRRGRRRARRRAAPTIEQLVAARAGGDARTALAVLELAVQTAARDGAELSAATSRTPRASARSSTTRRRRHYDFISPGSSRRVRATCRRRSTTSR
jgi:putative ATPase